jgi:hypothetical protein
MRRMGRDGVFLILFVIAALGAWAIVASHTRRYHGPEPELTDHPVFLVDTDMRDDEDDRLLAAMCTRCQWNESSSERDTSAQEYELRHKARRHSRNVAAGIVSVDPMPAAGTPWTPGHFYTHLSVVTHGGGSWRARWLNRDEEPGVSEVWERMPG